MRYGVAAFAVLLLSGVSACNSDLAGSPQERKEGDSVSVEQEGEAQEANRVDSAGGDSSVSAVATRSKVDDDTNGVTLLRVPEGGIQPRVRVDRQGTVHMVYYRGDPSAGDLFYVVSEDSGERFSDPIRVNSQAGSAVAMGNIRGAQIAVDGDRRIHVVWNGSQQAKPRGTGGSAPMLYTRINDARTGFETQRNIARSTTGLDGGGSVCADDAGNVYVVWHGLTPGETGPEQRKVWVAASRDGGKTFAPEHVAYAGDVGTCPCCGMSSFVDSKGNVNVLFRSATGGINRDTYLLVSRNKGAEFTGFLLDRWKVGSCPMSGFAIAERNGQVLAAWETDGQVYYGGVDGETGKLLEPIAATGPAVLRKHPVIAVNKERETVMVWTEGMSWNQSGSVSWQVFDRLGRPTSERGHVDGVPTWSLVDVYVRPDGGFTILY